MKKTILIFVAVALLASLAIFWDPIIDFLPIDQSRWVERNGNRYLLDEDGDPRIGWFSSEEGRFYFCEDGAMHTGWLEEESGRYYFSPEGNPYTGWQDVDGAQRYFDDQGCLISGLLEQGGKRFYLDENGIPTEGWQQVGEKICYVTRKGAIPSGWLEVDGEKYYLDDRGFRYTGWLDDSDGRYYFAADGIMSTGWLNMGGNSYYMGNDGIMTTGWTQIKGETYYFDEAGQLCTGWLELEGKRYYLRANGTPAVGKLEIDGQNYFFTSQGVNFIMVNPWNPLPEGFEVELVEAQGARMDPACQEALEQMLSDCRAAGHDPRIVSSYRSIADQQANLQRMIDSYTSQGVGYNRAYAIATQIVAVPGTSEHHLGLAFDIVDAAYPKLNHDQAKMPTQQWLMENSWKYGFIMRYPEGSTEITGIIYEPWHYRYVGVELAAELHELGNITLEEYIDNLTNDGTTCGGQQTEE